jgi:hypothetical protein
METAVNVSVGTSTNKLLNTVTSEKWIRFENSIEQ